MSKWLALQPDVSAGVHVVPLGDAVQHSIDDCLCGPTVEPVPRDDGSMGWLTTHHSLDGRERNE